MSPLVLTCLVFFVSMTFLFSALFGFYFMQNNSCLRNCDTQEKLFEDEKRTLIQEQQAKLKQKEQELVEEKINLSKHLLPVAMNTRNEVRVFPRKTYILWAQHIFIPAREMISTNLQVIQSIIDYFDWFPHEKVCVDVVVGGWILNETLTTEFLQKYEEMIQPHHLSVQLRFLPIQLMPCNAGLAYTLNKVIKTHWDDKRYEFVVTNQSDIRFLPSSVPYTLTKMVWLFDQQPKAGMITFNIDIDPLAKRFHLVDEKWSKIVYKFLDQQHVHEIQLLSPPGGGGIAGSCTMYTMEAFKDVGGYKVTGIYSPEDAWMLQSMYEANYRIFLVKTLFMEHFFTEFQLQTNLQEQYQAWKQTHLGESITRTLQGKHLEIDDLMELSKEVTPIFEKNFLNSENK